MSSCTLAEGAAAAARDLLAVEAEFCVLAFDCALADALVAVRFVAAVLFVAAFVGALSAFLPLADCVAPRLRFVATLAFAFAAVGFAFFVAAFALRAVGFFAGDDAREVVADFVALPAFVSRRQ